MVVEASFTKSPLLLLKLERISNLITTVFAVELLLRLFVIRSLRRFFGGYWLDCLAVAPLLRPLRILRVLRLLRLFRVGILLHRWVSRFESTFSRGYREYFVVGMVAATMILTGAMSIYFLEGGSNAGVGNFRKAMWWATYTMMAGEPIGSQPQTVEGRIVLLVMMLGGMTVFAMLTGTISAVMVERLRFSLEARDMQIEELENHIIVCGWNRGGSRLITELGTAEKYKDQAIVVIADFPEGQDPDIDFRKITRERVFVYRRDYTRIQSLQDAGIERASLAILLADKLGSRNDQDRDARTVLAALSIERLCPGIFTCVELLHQENAPPLRLAGVEEVVIASELSSTIMAHASLNNGLVALFDEILTGTYGNAFYKSELPTEFVGKSFDDLLLVLREKYAAILLSAERKDETLREPSKDPQLPWEQFVNPDKSFRFQAGDRVVYLSRHPVQWG
jgi:voltage-gated potassium channel